MPSHDTAYFSIVGLEQAYWAGFLAADGNMRRTYWTLNRVRVGSRLSLSVKVADRAHLATFAEAIGYTGQIRTRRVNGFEVCRIDVYGVDQMVDDLETNFGVPAQAKPDIRPPHLSGDLRLAYCAGYIDGDGSVVPWPDGRLRAVQWFGNQQMTSWIKDTMDAVAPPARPTQITSLKGGFIHRIEGVRAQPLVDAVTTLPVPWMDRKWNFEQRRLAA